MTDFLSASLIAITRGQVPVDNRDEHFRDVVARANAICTDRYQEALAEYQDEREGTLTEEGRGCADSQAGS